MANQDSDIQLASELRTVVSRLMKKLRSKSSLSEKLSLTERSVLRQLNDYGELLSSELAVMEKVTSQSMSGIVSHLSELGYITRKESETDKRKVLISLSKAGLTILNKTRHERDEWLHRAIGETLTAREQEMLKKLIVPLLKVIDFE